MSDNTPEPAATTAGAHAIDLSLRLHLETGREDEVLDQAWTTLLKTVTDLAAGSGAARWQAEVRVDGRFLAGEGFVEDCAPGGASW